MTYKQTDRDLIIELAYTVAKLERKVERLEKSLQEPSPWATAEEVRLVDEKAEMLIDDVVMLDERTRVAGKPQIEREIDFIQRSFE